MTDERFMHIFGAVANDLADLQEGLNVIQKRLEQIERLLRGKLFGEQKQSQLKRGQK